MGEKSGVCQALLKSEFAYLYPGIVSNEWQPATMLLAQVASIGRGQRGRALEPEATLDPEHFALRETSSAGAKQLARELRSMGKQRRRSL
jgi:hypothetical protein